MREPLTARELHRAFFPMIVATRSCCTHKNLDKLYFYSLTSGTGLYLVCQCQAPSAYSSTPNLNMGDYNGWTWLSPPATYPSTVGHEANEGSR
jgi:hypothetical protein